jgi:multimeric flavodoxin WrbA
MSDGLQMNDADCIHTLGVVGSPRRGGNTEIVVDAVLAGAIEAGAESEKVILNELRITPCQNCQACRKNGECIQADDMRTLYEKMERSPAWVLGTPVYWWGPTAQFKAFLDRWYGAGKVNFKGKNIVLVIPFGASDPHYARHLDGILTDVLDYLGMNLIEKILVPGATSKGTIKNRSQILAKARCAGAKMIQECTQT